MLKNRNDHFYYISSNVLYWFLLYFIKLGIKSMGVYILGLYWLNKKKKKKLTSHRLWIFNHFGEPQLFYIGILNGNVSHFCLIYNILIVQINNTICHIFILSLPFLTFFCFSFHIFSGNLSLIKNHINNICVLKSLSYNKLVHGDKNGNVILSLTRILGKFNT